MKPISISLSPNTERDDVLLALKLIFQPWIWKSGKRGERAEERLAEKLKNYLALNYAIFFNSGRSALLAILKCLDFKPGNEILLQAFTCNAAANPIIWTGLKPVYVDCNERTFNMDVDDLKRKITSKSRAVMLQHTFGFPAEIDEISEICRKNNLLLIEDCAHSLGAEYRGRKTGGFGRVSFCSFGRDKVISSVFGGAVLTNDSSLAGKIKKFQESLLPPSNFWIFQQLLHPVLMNYLILPTYRILGKYLLVLFQRLRILSKAVQQKEKNGGMPGYFPKRLPESLAILALNQLEKIERFNRHRREIALIYCNEFKGSQFELPPADREGKQIFLRFSIKHPRAAQILKKARRENILLGDWYTSPVAPEGTKLDKLQYVRGSCPQAEKLAREVLNLPTHINIYQKEANKIIDFLRKF